MSLNQTALARIRRARANGIISPLTAWRAAHKTDLPYWAACSLLMQESYGGRNVWGSDPTQFAGYGEVTECAYQVYKRQRQEGMAGAQGCGPCQLTYWPFQDHADKLGGCWKPYPNMLVGFGLLRSHYDQFEDWWEAARRYNGSGAAAEDYADRMVDRFNEWRSILDG